MTEINAISPVATSSQTATAAHATAPAAHSIVAQAATIVKNPRVLIDPSAGLVTEYLNNAGSQVVSQIPSAASVAYLRIGLTAEGLEKNEAPLHAKTVA
jgi:hypothetical protein